MEDASGNGQTLATGLIGHVTLASVVGLSLETGQNDECVHFWVIETPNGPTSQGTCKLCGKEQEFRNSVSSSTWNRGIAKQEDGWG